jgi:hypothetical protein
MSTIEGLVTERDRAWPKGSCHHRMNKIAPRAREFCPMRVSCASRRCTRRPKPSLSANHWTRSAMMTAHSARVIESGMPRKNGQRKPGTTRGSPRRSRTAKALRISRSAVKSRWGRLRMIGRVEETSASFEARSAPRLYPTERLGVKFPGPTRQDRRSPRRNRVSALTSNSGR